jgi:hypothetical protein
MARTMLTSKLSARTIPTSTGTRKGDSPKAPPESTQKKATTLTNPKKSTKKSSSTPAHCTIADSLDVILPLSLGKSNGECTVLVQIDPEDSRNLDFEGTTGAIGRFQVTQQGLILDLKGSQYQGHLVPGPTVTIATLWYDEQHQQQLRLEAITDEFCPLHKTQDTMAKLDALVLKGELDDSYRMQEENVNVSSSAKRQQQQQEQQQADHHHQQSSKKQQPKKMKKTPTSTTTTTGKKVSKKRPASSKTTTTTKKTNKPNKKAKVSLGKSTKK